MGHIPHFPPGIRVERVAPDQDARVWRDALRGFDPSGAKVLKGDRGVAVYRASMAGLDVVIKAWELGPGLPRIKQLLHASRAWRHWRGAARLQHASIPTARGLALLSERARGGLVVEWLAMEALPGRTLLEVLAAIHADPGAVTVKRQHALARVLGRQLADLERAGLFNRDHKPSNLIVAWSEEHPADGTHRAADEPRVSMIDCVAIQGLGRHSWRRVRRMLASLLIEPTGCGLAIRRGLRLRVLASFLDAQAPLPRDLRRRAIRAGWTSVEALIHAHGDPTPRVNPLKSPHE